MSAWRFRLLPAALALAGAALAQSTFVLTAESLQPYTPAYLGNGALSLVTTPLATDAAQCFVAGLYDHSPGDVPRIISAPAWNAVDIYNGSHWLNSLHSFSTIEQYRQTLDMLHGNLQTSYLWADGEKRIALQSEEFVSRERGSIAASRVRVTPQFEGTLTIRFPLENWPPPQRYQLAQIQHLDPAAAQDPWKIWYPGRLDVRRVNVESHGDGAVFALSGSAPGYRTNLAEAIAISWTGAPQIQIHQRELAGDLELHLHVRPRNTYTFTKFVSLIRSPNDETRAATQKAIEARARGWESLLAESEAAWEHLWESDIIVEGDDELQRVIHSMLFYLLGSARKDLDMSTPPMGLSSSGYFGHIFWDADTYIFPALLLLHPDLARPMVAFRSRTLPEAEHNAQRNGYREAMYPWEADPDGVECTPRFAFQNASSENHVNGDVALAAWQYWQATGDHEWLSREAWPVLRGTADFWTSRVKYVAARDRYEIAGVVAVKESDVGVSNDAYTNAVARRNLELALDAARLLQQPANPKWQEIAAKLFVPETDSPLLWFPLELPHSRQQTQAAIEHSLSDIDKQQTGAMMGTEFYPILAAELGDRTLIGRLLKPLVLPYLRPPFQVIAETPDNRNTSFITGAGAFLQQFLFGYSGLRLTDRGLERRFSPVLPPGVRKLRLKNLTVRNTRQTFEF